MKRILLVIALSATALSASSVAAPGDAVPNIFTNGTPADADQVNANFSELVTQISTVAATYSYRDFGSLFDTKTFAVVDTSNAYNREVRTYDRSVPGQVSYTRDRSLANVTIQYNTITLDNNGPELLFTKLEKHDPANTTTILETRTMEPGVTLRTETMEEGKTFGSDSYLFSNTKGGSGVIQTTTLIASNQGITVPAGTYTGCIKIARHRSSSRLGGTYDRINTFCPNVGLVRQYHAHEYYDASATPAPAIKTRTIIKELINCNGGAC